MSGLKQSSLGLLVSAFSLSLGSWAADGWAQSESGVQACAKAYEDAQVQRNGGHLKAAQDQLKICVQDQCPDFVRSDCVNWLSEVNSALPTVTFAAVDSAGADLFDVKVTVDGVVVAESLDGRAIEVDPGQHTLVLEYQGMKVEQKLLVRQGEKNRVVRSQMTTVVDTDGDGVPDPEDKCPTVAGTKERGGCPPPSIDDDPLPPGATPRSVWRNPLFLGGVIAGGVGVAGFVTSGIFLQLENSEREDAHEECDEPNMCTAERQQELIDSNVAKANMQTAGLIVGGVGVVTSGVLFYLWYKDREPAKPKAGELNLDVTGSDQGGFMQVRGVF